MNSSKIDNEHSQRSLTEIPLTFRSIFSNYTTFNKVQSHVLDKVLHTDESVVIGAPTGSGKTVIFELAIVRLLMKMEKLASGEDFKIVYVAPVKALCMERISDWREKFETSSIGLKCLSATGDCDVSNFASLETGQLIVTTPEKWDSLTRKWKDSESMMESVKLFLIDEVHLLGEDARGPTLEAIVSRMKTIQYSMRARKRGDGAGMGLRFVAASATIPNIEDLATWLGDETPASFYSISESMRPVQLQKHVIGFNTNAQGFRFDMNLNYKLAPIIRKYSDNKPTLIFCSTRKSVEMATQVLAEESSLMSSLSDTHKMELQAFSRRIHDTKLKQLVIKGIGFHHAGLSYEDRAIVEDAFRKSRILILVCTSSLAMGVNFPAHLVIIKSTANYVCGKCQEYTESAILQMIGRAGRPQYDLHGVAVIMTQQKNVKKYENLMNGCTPVESHLQKHLAEHLNSEIVLQTVTDLTVAMKWIRSTFLYVRAVKSPANYGFGHGMQRDEVEKKLEEICIFHINSLERCGLIVKDQAFGLSIASTSIGRLMARYYVSFDTIKMFWQLQGNESFLEVFNTITFSKEFSDFTLRVNEKKTLNKINDHPIRFPIKGKIKTNENKVSCLIQAVFDNIPIQDLSMTQDAYRMVRIGEKLSKCLSEYIRLTESQFLGKIYKTFSSSLIIAKCFKTKLWNNTIFVSKQLKNIGETYATRLARAGKTTIQSILETDPRQIEMILGKAPPFGDQIIDTLSAYPKYSLELCRKGNNFLDVTVSQCSDSFSYDGQNATLVVGDADNNLLFHHNKIDEIICEEGIFRKTIPLKNTETVFVQAKLIHENLIGVDREEKLTLNPEVELAEPKRTKRKIQTRLRTKTIQRTNYKEVVDEKSNLKDQKTLQSQIDVVEKNSPKNRKQLKSLLDDDEDFTDLVNFDELDKSFTEPGPLRVEPEIIELEDANTDQPRQPHDVEHSSSDVILKKPFDIPVKLPGADHMPEDISHRNSTPSASNRQQLITSISGHDDSNEYGVDNEILQEIFQNNCELEEDFINSQMMRGVCNEIHVEEDKAMDLSTHLSDTVKENKALDFNTDLNFDLDCLEFSTESIGDKNGTNQLSNSPINKNNTIDSVRLSRNPEIATQSSDLNSETSSQNIQSCNINPKPEITSDNFVDKNVTSTPSKNQATNNSINIDSGIATTTEIPPNTPKSPAKGKKRLNFEKLRNFLLNPAKKLKQGSSTQVVESSQTCTKEDLERFSRSCHFKLKSRSAGIWSQPVPASPIAESNSKTSQENSRSTECPDLLATDREIQIHLLPKSGEIKSIYRQTCEKYLGKENFNMKNKEFLHNLEKNVETVNEDITTDNYRNIESKKFFDDTDRPSSVPALTEKRTNQFTTSNSSVPLLTNTSSNIQQGCREILKFRSALQQQYLHNRVLKLETKPNEYANNSLIPITNREKNRIDQLIHQVAKQPIKPILPFLDDRYRMKMPRRRWKCSGQETADWKPNLSFMGKCNPKSESINLNRSFPSFGKTATDFSTFSSTRWSGGDEKRIKLDPEKTTLNIASLPKPDFEAIEIERTRRQNIRQTDSSDTESLCYSPAFSVAVEHVKGPSQRNEDFDITFEREIENMINDEPDFMLTQNEAREKLVESQFTMESVGFLNYEDIKREQNMTQNDDDIMEIMAFSPSKQFSPLGSQNGMDVEIYSPLQYF